MGNKHSYRARIYSSYTQLYSPKIQHRTSADLDNNAKTLLARLSDWLPVSREALCLDVACGTGSLLYALRKAGYLNLFGVDASSPQASVSKTLFPQVVEGDAIEYLLKHQETFDLITAFDIIEHFDKAELFIFLDAVYFALKPGGSIIIQTPNADSPWFGSVRYGDLTHELSYTPLSLSHAMTIAGYERYSVKECPPYVHGFNSFMRAFLWRAFRMMYLFSSLVETGSTGSGIFTRVFIAKADKPL